MDVVEQSLSQVPPEGVVPRAAYARLNKRVNAILIDMTITGLVFVLLVVVASVAENVPRSGGLFVIVAAGLFLLYEPLQVWRFGATIGHRWANIRVVSDKTGGPPSLPASFGRYLAKSLLGLPSFISMAFTRRHQAIHDLLTGTTVQLRDLSMSSDSDYVLERAPDTAILASRSRRLCVTVLYLVGASILYGLFSVALLSSECISSGHCSSVDNSNAQLITFLFFFGRGGDRDPRLARAPLWGTVAECDSGVRSRTLND